MLFKFCKHVYEMLRNKLKRKHSAKEVTGTVNEEPEALPAKRQSDEPIPKKVGMLKHVHEHNVLVYIVITQLY